MLKNKHTWKSAVQNRRHFLGGPLSHNDEFHNFKITLESYSGPKLHEYSHILNVLIVNKTDKNISVLQ